APTMPSTGTRGGSGPSGTAVHRRRRAPAAGRGARARTCRSCRSTWGGVASKDLSFVPIKRGLVAEVTFGQLETRRFRHGVKFLRWRPDRSPESCRYDKLDVAEQISFAEFFSRCEVQPVVVAG